MDVYDFSTQEVLGGSCSRSRPHYKGYSGFKSVDGNVILNRLGPLMGRVSLQAGGAKKLQYSGLPSHIFKCIFIMI